MILHPKQESGQKHLLEKPKLLGGGLLLLSLLIVLLLGNYAYRDSERVLEQTYETSYGNALKNSSRVLDMNLRTVIEAARGFLNEPELKAVLQKYNDVPTEQFSTADRHRLSQTAEMLANQNAAVNTILFMDLQGTHYLLNNVNQGTYEFDRYYQEKSLLAEDWVQASRDAKGKELFLGKNIYGVPQGNVFFLTKYLINPSTQRPMGYLAIGLNKSLIMRSIVNNAAAYETSVNFVSSGEEMVSFMGSEEREKGITEVLAGEDLQQKYLLVSVTNETTGWKLCNMVERSELGGESRSLRRKVWLGGAAVLVLLLMLVYLVLTNQRLAEHLMATRLNEREAELLLLQSQINPHFLYNTLDSLYFLAIIHEDDEVADMTVALSEHFKLTLNNGSKYRTVESSLQWIRGYLKLMNFRFHDRFRLIEEVDSELLNCEILTFLLQPCVENAMLHGLEPKIGNGTITIRVYRGKTTSTLCLEVEDDGVGMEDLTVWESGYGIRNVKERLQLNYGSEGRIQAESSRAMGTKVTITIPIE